MIIHWLKEMATPFYYRIYHTLFIKCSIHTLKLTKEDRRFRDLENNTFGRLSSANESKRKWTW